MVSTSAPATLHLDCDIGADFVCEVYLPGDYHAASALAHVRATEGETIIVSLTVTFGSYDSGNARTLMTLSLTDTQTTALVEQIAGYDVLVTLGTLSEFWLAGEFRIHARRTQPGVP
jgi:hypothetical protein